MIQVSDDQALLETFPPIYRQLLPDFFSSPVPPERNATCSRCAMCRPPGETDGSRGAVYYDPAVKCCSFHPSLPNFLVGAILEDPDPSMEEGKARVRQAIARRSGCVPTGLESSALYEHVYRNKSRDVFGRSPAMRCPYFREGELNCTIWRHRNAVCSTWYCKHVAGEDGREFWRAAKQYVAYLEWLLPRHFMLALGLQPKLQDENSGTRVLGLDDVEGRPDARRHAAVWGAWAGREEAFYVECHRLAAALRSEDVRHIAGSLSQEINGRGLMAAYSQMTAPVLPDPLLRNPHLEVRERAGGKRHVNSGGSDGIEIGADVLELLWAFDGIRSNAAARARLEEQGARMSQALIVGLYRHRLLVAAEP